MEITLTKTEFLSQLAGLGRKFEKPEVIEQCSNDWDDLTGGANSATLWIRGGVNISGAIWLRLKRRGFSISICLFQLIGFELVATSYNNTEPFFRFRKCIRDCQSVYPIWPQGS